MTTAADAGWYHDPSDSGAWRWWDGATWTEHVRPKEPKSPIPVAAAQEPVVAPAQPVAQPLQTYAEPPTISAPQAIYTAPISTAPVDPVTPLPPMTLEQMTLDQPLTLEQPAPLAQLEPAAPATPVPLTPSTPDSEQLYWHSAEAEIVPIPGRLAKTADAVYRAGGDAHVSGEYARIWGDAGSPQTVGIWLLALLPIISFVLTPMVSIAISATISTASVENFLMVAQSALAIAIGYSFFLVILAWVFAGNDARSLRLRGYAAPKIWWMLVPLSPLAYFIARGKAVRAEGKRAWPPEALFFVSIIVPIGLAVAAAIFSVNISELLSTIGVVL